MKVLFTISFLPLSPLGKKKKKVLFPSICKKCFFLMFKSAPLLEQKFKELLLLFKMHHLSYLRFQALYNYTPRNEDELELREGDVIDVMEKCDDGWFVGMFSFGCFLLLLSPDLCYPLCVKYLCKVF